MSFFRDLEETFVLGASPDVFAEYLIWLKTFEDLSLLDRFTGNTRRFNQLYLDHSDTILNILNTANRKAQSVGRIVTAWNFLSDDEIQGGRAFGDAAGDYRYSMPDVTKPGGGNEEILVYTRVGVEKITRARLLREAKMGVGQILLPLSSYTKISKIAEWFCPTHLSLMIPFEERCRIQPPKSESLLSALKELIGLNVISQADLADRELLEAKIEGLVNSVRGSVYYPSSNRMVGLDEAIAEIISTG